MRPTPSSAVAILVLALNLGACSTARLADYRPPSVSATTRRVESSGVEVAVDPFVENDRTKEYFALDATDEGIAILYLRIANKTADQTFLVEKKNILLLPRGATEGTASSDKKIERSQSLATGLAYTSVAAGGMALLFTAMAIRSRSTEVQRNLTSKEMPDATLSPGRSMEGFVYFTPVAKGGDWSRGATVRISMPDTRTQSLLTFDVRL